MSGGIYESPSGKRLHGDGREVGIPTTPDPIAERLADVDAEANTAWHRSGSTKERDTYRSALEAALHRENAAWAGLHTAVEAHEAALRENVRLQEGIVKLVHREEAALRREDQYVAAARKLFHLIERFAAWGRNMPDAAVLSRAAAEVQRPEVQEFLAALRGEEGE